VYRTLELVSIQINKAQNDKYLIKHHTQTTATVRRTTTVSILSTVNSPIHKMMFPQGRSSLSNIVRLVAAIVAGICVVSWSMDVSVEARFLSQAMGGRESSESSSESSSDSGSDGSSENVNVWSLSHEDRRKLRLTGIEAMIEILEVVYPKFCPAHCGGERNVSGLLQIVPAKCRKERLENHDFVGQHVMCEDCDRRATAYAQPPYQPRYFGRKFGHHPGNPKPRNCLCGERMEPKREDFSLGDVSYATEPLFSEALRGIFKMLQDTMVAKGLKGAECRAKDVRGCFAKIEDAKVNLERAKRCKEVPRFWLQTHAGRLAENKKMHDAKSCLRRTWDCLFDKAGKLNTRMLQQKEERARQRCDQAAQQVTEAEKHLASLRANAPRQELRTLDWLLDSPDELVHHFIEEATKLLHEARNIESDYNYVPEGAPAIAKLQAVGKRLLEDGALKELLCGRSANCFAKQLQKTKDWLWTDKVSRRKFVM
jgi:hypothetical protein